ncbi:DUF3102 domain-containing protein [Azospirillum sp. TSA2s]|uniref:DUF3102 domain-containing protein n=1 Tax=Azospirillum sp. TSA2s TaxID=709810 RepID=UPI0010AB12DC|nr:DUF3102 domain-containing protein [Azospirillum sp. TSA2s]QCG94505.1 DUF3102 domain-containing protein [Azospirillum sp. TSA2s]
MAKKPLPIDTGSSPSSAPAGQDVISILRSATAGMPSLTNPQGGAVGKSAVPTSPLLSERTSGSIEILPPEGKPDSVADYVTTISRLYDEAEERFVQIGRHLIEAKARLQHGEWSKMVALLPFSHRTATMLMTAARAITNRTIAPERAPRSWANVYLLASMSEEERKLAEERDLIRPDVTRREILAFRRQVSGGGQGGDDLMSEAMDSVAEEIARLLQEKARIEARLAELQGSRVAATVEADG